MQGLLSATSSRLEGRRAAVAPIGAQRPFPVARSAARSSTTRRAVHVAAAAHRPHRTVIRSTCLQPAARQSQRVSGVPVVRQPARAAPQPRIFAAAFRRGSKLVVCATLAGAEAASRVEQLAADVAAPAAIFDPSKGWGPEEEEELAGNKDLVVGRLENGLQYVVLPNKTPPNRFEAHLQVHAGSVDEHEHEQGVAHLVEHVTFLGSKKREALLGTGARANAYTDFHHTVFHVHAPLRNAQTNQPMLPQVLDALVEVAFQPQFLPSRIEKERLAVLAEAQMMNTIEYRVDCQLLQYLHHENALGCRFPIGKIEQVKKWEYDVLQSFWRKWYFPANATLYVIGDLDIPPAEIQNLIRTTFGRVPPGREPTPAPATLTNPASSTPTNGTPAPPPAAAPAASAATPAASAEAPPLPPLKQRHPVRPPVEHQHGIGPLPPNFTPAPVNIFRHPLLQQFTLTVFCKLPVQPLQRMGDLKRMFMLRVILSTFQFRISRRYAAATPQFAGIDLDISDSGREGCGVSTLTITSDPCDWQAATSIAVQEMRRLQRFGLTKGELERYRDAMVLDSEQMAAAQDSIPSNDTLEFVMDSLALGHTVMSHQESHDAVLAVAQRVTLDEVNAMCRSLLSFGSDYAAEVEILADAAANPQQYLEPGPTRATSIVACVPAFTNVAGASVAAGSSGPRRPMGASGHLDVDTIDMAALEAQAAQVDDVEIPEDAVEFKLSGQEIAEALAGRGLEVTPAKDVEIPDALLPLERVQELMEELKPEFVPLAGPGADGPTRPPKDPITGIIQRRLSNGIRVNMRQTDNEPKSCMLRLIASGGRAAEDPSEIGPAGVGSVGLGMRTLSESGALAGFQREQVEVFCISKLINSVLEADDEFLVMDSHYAVAGTRALFEMVHLLMEDATWDPAALERAKSMFASHTRALPKSLERATSARVMEAMMGPDKRFGDVPIKAVEALELEAIRAKIAEQLHAGNVEISIVGDFDEEETEELVLQYLGTIRPKPEMGVPVEAPIVLQNPPLHVRHTTWHLRDSDERACAYIAGPAPMRWGPFGSADPPKPPPHKIVPPEPLRIGASTAERDANTLLRRSHPVYSSVILMLLQESINSRLFTMVRDSLGLTYDVSFEILSFDRLRASWFTVNVTSYPNKIQEALMASIEVLRDIRVSPITQRELSRARRTLLTRHESDLKTNAYWIGLLTHLQNDNVPLKTLECLRDLRAIYDSITPDDLHEAIKHFNFDNDNIFTCVGTSGREAPPPPPVPFYELPQTQRLTSSWGPAASWGPTRRVATPASNFRQGAGTGPDTAAAFFSAMLAATQGMGLAEAFRQLQQQSQQGGAAPGAGGASSSEGSTAESSSSSSGSGSGGEGDKST